eukprot:14292021-Alexandrium_andersonii.AAC.1
MCIRDSPPHWPAERVLASPPCMQQEAVAPLPCKGKSRSATMHKGKSLRYHAKGKSLRYHASRSG